MLQYEIAHGAVPDLLNAKGPSILPRVDFINASIFRVSVGGTGVSCDDCRPFELLEFVAGFDSRSRGGGFDDTRFRFVLSVRWSILHGGGIIAGWPIEVTVSSTALKLAELIECPEPILCLLLPYTPGGELSR